MHFFLIIQNIFCQLWQPLNPEYIIILLEEMVDMEGREKRSPSIVTCLECMNPWLSTQVFPNSFCLVCRLYTASLGIHTEHSRKDPGIFCKGMKFDFFGLEVSATQVTTWTEPPFPTLLWLKKSFQIPKAGGPSGTAGRRSYSCTVHLYFNLFVFPAISLAHREKLHSLLPAFCRFPLK